MLRVISVASLAALVLANDPADSWLVYAKAAGAGSKVLSVNASWVVPSYPTTRAGGNAPGWWFGIEPNPADVLIQPILAYGDGVPEYQIFTGFYDWHDGQWQQSKVANVKPGQTIQGSIWLDSATGLYKQSINVLGSKPIVTTVTKAQMHGEIFTDVYFVVEHQPDSCAEYPANGNIVFTDIDVHWESGTPATWTVAQFKPACNSLGKVLNSVRSNNVLTGIHLEHGGMSRKNKRRASYDV